MCQRWLNESMAQRRVDSSAFTALAPLVVLLAPWLVAMFVIWLPIGIFSSVSFLSFAAIVLASCVVLFLRPVQRLVFARMLGARKPTANELERLEPAWREVAQANGFQPGRFVLAVVDADDLNAFACGGHLLIVSSFAVDNLTDDELTGVLAHELSHHLGGHTVALTIAQWMSLPVLGVARVGIRLRNLSDQATTRFGAKSTLLRIFGIAITLVLTGASRLLLLGLVLAQMLGNFVGRGSEYHADRRAYEMGFGRELLNALRHVSDGRREADATSGMVVMSHPPARTRIAKLEAMMRSGNRP
jgi:Zn-dependent protease with chaperone function